MSKHYCELDKDDYIEVQRFPEDVRLEVHGSLNFVRLSPEEALRMAKKLKKFAKELKEGVTIS